MSTHPITLSLELSQLGGSVAMMNSSGDIESATILGEGNKTDDVFPSIVSTAELLHISPNEIELVAVSIGPGGFTGLRTSVSISKMIALSTRAKLVSVESAIVTASQGDVGDGPFFVISSVKNENFWLSLVQKKDGVWMCDSAITTTSELLDKTDTVYAAFVDDFLPSDTKCLFEKNNTPLYPSRPDATTLLHLGVELFTSGVVVDPHHLLPIYPREPEAVRVWKTRPSRL